MGTTVTTEQTKRMEQISNELTVLVAKLQCIAEQALPLVEEIENDFQVRKLQPEVKANFLTMRRLITKV